MLYFHKNPNDKLGQEISEILADLSASHKVLETTEPSHIADNNFPIKGRPEILHFLENYGKIISSPHSISADACRIDPETGTIC